LARYSSANTSIATSADARFGSYPATRVKVRQEKSAAIVAALFDL
jgi:hypothetical protein